MRQDRKAVLEHFTSKYLPSMQVAEEWGPSFIPDMPTQGCAVGLLARSQETEGTRFFHIVVDGDAPSFIKIPGSSTVLPLEEVIRGYFLTEHPELERGQTYLFRFMTGGVMVRELIPKPEPTALEEDDPADGATEGWAGEDLEAESRDFFRTGAFPIPGRGDPDRRHTTGKPPAPPQTRETPAPPGPPAEATEPMPPKPSATPAAPQYRRVRQSVVVRVVARKRMPESLQAQLLRALERQVSLRTPLIGWSDLYPVIGPLDLAGLDGLMEWDGR